MAADWESGEDAEPLLLLPLRELVKGRLEEGARGVRSRWRPD